MHLFNVHIVLLLNYTLKCQTQQHLILKYYFTRNVTSLKIIFSRLSPLLTNLMISLCLQSSRTPLCICTTFSLSTHPVEDICLVSISWLMWIGHQQTLVYKSLWIRMFSYLVICQWVVYLGHLVDTVLVFWRFSILFSREATPVHIPSKNECRVHFLHNLDNIWCQILNWF